MGKMLRIRIGKNACIPVLGLLLVVVSCSEMKPYRLEPGELFPGGKPLGQPYTHKQPEIRMVRVSSVHEADSFCTAIRDEYPGCRISYTHGTPAGTYEVGIVRVMDSAVIAKGIREIRFVETIKPKRK